MKNRILIGRILTKDAMKSLMGGSTILGELGEEDPTLGTCCWHFKDWKLQHQCGLKRADAIIAANIYHAMWCCDSCPPDVW